MNSKKLYYANNTKRVLDNVFPSHFKIVDDKASNGYKFVNAAYGVEIDNIYSYLDQSKHMNNLELFDYGVDFDFYEVIIKDNVIDNTVYSDLADIKITDNQEFYDGSPTRLEFEGRLLISGVEYGAVGLEYLRTTPEGSGIFYINMEIDAADAVVSPGYQSFKLPIDDLGTVDQIISGVNPAIKRQDYTSTGLDEVLGAPINNELELKYPLQRMIKAPISGVEDNPFEYYYIDHYSPNNGYYWDTVDNIYKAKGYDTDFYYEDVDSKIYYRTAFNNPYGTGIYDTVYINLQNIPISGTLKVYDFDNLGLSGELVEITISGTQLYYHSGIYGDNEYAPYLGYESGVPYEFAPQEYSGIPTAAPYKLVSWDYCKLSGGLDDNFNWVEYDSNPITNRIKITNPSSRYLVEYDYQVVKQNKYMTTLNSTKYIKYDDGNYLFSILGNTDSLVEIDSDFSKDPSRRAIVFDGIDIRPGTTIDKLEIAADAKIADQPLLKSNYTISLDKLHAGYTQTIEPNKNDHRSYILNERMNNTSLVLTNEASTVYDINYESSNGIRTVYNSGEFYYSSGVFMDLDSDSDSSNRYFKTAFKPYKPIQEEISLGYSYNLSGEYWNVYIDENRYIVIKDQHGTFITYDRIYDTITPKEIIVERDMRYDEDQVDYEYAVYYKDADDLFLKFELSRAYLDNVVPSGNNSVFYENASVDIKSIQIYEEAREYTDV